MGGCQDFTSKNYCLTVPKLFVWDSFTVALLSGTENVWRRGGGLSRFYVETILSDSAEKIRMEILYC